MTKHLTKAFIIILLIPITVLAETFYSIQISSRKNLKDAVKILQKAKKYPEPRVDKIGGLYKVRVGLFNTYNEAKNFLIEKKIDREFKGAFITTVTDKTLKNSIFPQDSTEKTEKKKEVKEEKKETAKAEPLPKEDNLPYSIEIFKSKTRNETAKFIEELPKDIKKYAFLYPENDTYSARLFVKDSRIEIDRKEKELSYLHFESNIVKTDPKKIEIVKEKPAKIPEKKTLKKEPVKKSKVKPPVEKNKENKSNPLNYLIAIAGIITVAGAVILLRKKRTKFDETPKDLYETLTEATEKGNTELVKEIVVPYLTRYPEDLTAQEIYAQALEKEGKYMEAAEIYFTMAEVSEGKKLFEKAEKYRKKGEDLVNREFIKKNEH